MFILHLVKAIILSPIRYASFETKQYHLISFLMEKISTTLYYSILKVRQVLNFNPKQPISTISATKFQLTLALTSKIAYYLRDLKGRLTLENLNVNENVNSVGSPHSIHIEVRQNETKIRKRETEFEGKKK